MQTLENKLRVEKIAEIKKAVSYHKFATLRLQKPSECTKEELREFKAFNLKFLKCLHHLDEFEEKCIQHTFIEGKFYWWEGYYSNAQYYRYRNKAIDNFYASFFKI